MKVLIITYYWPPAGGPGVQRWLKFVKYLRDFDIEPVLYTPQNPTYALTDESLIDEIPDGIKIIKRPIFEPYRFAELLSKKDSKTISKGIIAGQKKQSFVQKLLLYIRGNFFIPDARKFWVKPSVKFLSDYLEQNGIDTIITTGPPHSVHLIGQGLREKVNVKWIADFRDPWTTIGYHHKLKLSDSSRKKHKALEKGVLNTADHVIVTSFTTKKEFEKITQTSVDVITNGYDVEISSDVQLDKKFSIAHIGSLLSGRNPEILWKALNELCQEHEAFRNNLVLNLVGAVSEDVLDTIRLYDLNEYIVQKGYVSHKEAVYLQRSSQVLLLVEIDASYTKCIIPGKLFEYMSSGRPILAIGPEGADVEKLIQETESGEFFTYGQFLELKQQIWEYFEAYQVAQLKTRTSARIDKYSRRNLTNRLADLIKSV